MPIIFFTSGHPFGQPTVVVIIFYLNFYDGECGGRLFLGFWVFLIVVFDERIHAPAFACNIHQKIWFVVFFSFFSQGGFVYSFFYVLIFNALLWTVSAIISKALLSKVWGAPTIESSTSGCRWYLCQTKAVAILHLKFI